MEPPVEKNGRGKAQTTKSGGRKPRQTAVVSEEPTSDIVVTPATAATVVTESVVATVTTAVTETKKAAKAPSKKKQFTVVAVVTPTSIEGSLQPENRKPLIAHLPIQSKDVMFNDSLINYNPAPPVNVEPYDAGSDNPFIENAATLESVVKPSETLSLPPLPSPIQSQNQSQGQSQGQSQNQNQIVQSHEPVPDYYKKGTLLVQFQNSEEVKTLPERVDAACFWCCHSFDWRPVVLPVRDQGEFIQVQGNFCCPECAMSHLFDARQDTYARWEQLSLLNRIYGHAVGGTIRPAPPKQILKLFGGPMPIEEYRDLIRKGKLRVDVHLPPMVSLLATMDTKPIDFYDVSLTKSVMETVGERLAKAEEVLKLRRTKPLKAWESTLDACINLRVRT